MSSFIYAVLSSLGLSLLFVPFAVKFLRRLKLGQPILNYVGQHELKAGTPTMGGIIFIFPAIIVSMIFGAYRSRLALLLIFVMCSYAIVGFLDDFIKVYFKNNQGLKAYQKIISQLLIAAAVTYASYRSLWVGSEIYLPFSKTYLNLGWWYLPFTIFVYIALTNSVNLTDGLDGLAAGSTSVYLFFFAIITTQLINIGESMGSTAYIMELGYVNIVLGAVLGGLLGFLAINVSKAKVFMGDTGSLSLGGIAAAIAVSTKMTLLILLIGLVYVWSAVSVIMQVIVFKLKKKRVFIMAPFHHHLELKGWSETRISYTYALVTAVCGMSALLII